MLVFAFARMRPMTAIGVVDLTGVDTPTAERHGFESIQSFPFILAEATAPSPLLIITGVRNHKFMRPHCSAVTVYSAMVLTSLPG